MIDVRNKRIYFYNANKREVSPVDFHCMSAYVCPHCKMVLAAYYAGALPDLEPFMEDKSLMYHYAVGGVNGGQYLLLEQSYHERECGNREIVSLLARGITHQVDVWAKRYDVESGHLQKLSQMISGGGVPGFDIIPDVCGGDEPILLYQEHVFTNIDEPAFDEQVERRGSLSAYVGWLVSDDHSKPFVPPIKPGGDTKEVPKPVTPSLADIESGKVEQPANMFSEVIDAYTRADAIRDGVLMDVTETAKEAGIVYPTAVTQALWDGYITPPESLKGFQDLQGRLWDVLTMFVFAAKSQKKSTTEVAESSRDALKTLFYKVIFQMPSRTINPKMETVDLKAVCGPGDNAEPTITIMLQDEY